MCAAIGTRLCPDVGCWLVGGRHAPAEKHWLAQPAAVRHCGNDPQSFIALWHEQSLPNTINSERRTTLNVKA